MSCWQRIGQWVYFFTSHWLLRSKPHHFSHHSFEGACHWLPFDSRDEPGADLTLRAIDQSLMTTRKKTKLRHITYSAEAEREIQGRVGRLHRPTLLLTIYQLFSPRPHLPSRSRCCIKMINDIIIIGRRHCCFDTPMPPCQEHECNRIPSWDGCQK